MILMTGTSDLISVACGSSVASVNIHASFIDNDAGVITPGRTNTIITSSTVETTVVGSPASSTQRSVKHISIVNSSASSTTITVKHTDGSNKVPLFNGTLQASEQLHYVDGDGWVYQTALGASQLGALSVSGNIAASQMPALTGDVTSTAGTVATTVGALQGHAVSASAPASTDVLAWNGSTWAPTTPAATGVTNVGTSYPLSGGPITGTGTITSVEPKSCGRLIFNSATQIAFNPYNGDLYKCAGALYQITSGGITAANTSVRVNGTTGQNLAASTTYYVSVNAAGVIGFWSQASYSHLPDTTAGNIGVEVISSSGTPTTGETLIGMVRTNASSQFQSDSSNTLVVTWFNRQQRGLNSSLTSKTITNTTSAEVSSSNRCTYLVWSDENTAFSSFNGYVQLASSASFGYVQLNLDGTVVTQLSAASIINNQWTVSQSWAANGLSEGLHYFTVNAYVYASGSFALNCNISTTLRA